VQPVCLGPGLSGTLLPL